MGLLNGGGGSSSSGGTTYPGWVGYIEYDDETGEAIGADYSGLELAVLPDNLKFNSRGYKGDWMSNISKITNGLSMFSGCTNLSSFNGDLSSLTNGNNMFYNCSNLTSFNGDLSALTTGSAMFQSCTNLSSFNGDLSALTTGSYMFSGCNNLTSFNGDLSSLTIGYDMFNSCNNLTSFNGDLSSLTNGEFMFYNCKLDAVSVEKILTTIPTHTDGNSHTLTMRVQKGEAVDKIKEITGITGDRSVYNYKGWTINLTSVQV